MTVDDPERMRGGLGRRVVSPEKGFLIVSARRDPAPPEDAILENGSRADRHAVPERRSQDRGAGPDPGPSDDARRRVEAPGRLSGEDMQPVIEIPAALRERSAAVERFERRAQEIARAAEIGVRAMVEDEAKLFPPLVQERLPEVGDEGRFAGRNPLEQPRRQDANSGVEQRPWFVDAESRDAIPFGLKRRVVIRVPIFRDEERRRAPRFPVTGEKGADVRLDGRVRVDDQKIAGPEKSRGVAERPGRAEDRWLAEEGELRELRKLIAQVALHLIAEVMQINRYFADAGIVKSPEMRDRDGDV
ncbi:MAG: hypothetical protein WAU32_08455 [Thermoanaerobaculia bacterium]